MVQCYAGNDMVFVVLNLLKDTPPDFSGSSVTVYLFTNVGV
jgi:hypothetical protein